MDIQMVERLAAAGACLEGARELVEVGGVEWGMIGKVGDLVEALLGFEVREDWPPAEVPGAASSLDGDLLKRLWVVLESARSVCIPNATMADLEMLRAALAAVPEGWRP